MIGENAMRIACRREHACSRCRRKSDPGLYANFLTAGGIAGENNYGSQWTNTSLMGANGLSWCSGYLAAKSALAGK